MCLCRYKSKKKAFCHYAKKYSDGSKGIQADLDQLRKQATVIRVLAHTQIGKIGFGQKKAHLSEIQVLLLLIMIRVRWSSGISCSNSVYKIVIIHTRLLIVTLF